MTNTPQYWINDWENAYSDSIELSWLDQWLIQGVLWQKLMDYQSYWQEWYLLYQQIDKKIPFCDFSITCDTRQIASWEVKEYKLHYTQTYLAVNPNTWKNTWRTTVSLLEVYPDYYNIGDKILSKGYRILWDAEILSLRSMFIEKGWIPTIEKTIDLQILFQVEMLKNRVERALRLPNVVAYWVDSEIDEIVQKIIEFLEGKNFVIYKNHPRYWELHERVKQSFDIVSKTKE